MRTRCSKSDNLLRRMQNICLTVWWYDSTIQLLLRILAVCFVLQYNIEASAQLEYYSRKQTKRTVCFAIITC
ncbi:hypothetical protein DICVIV_08901 [Dictyocaulus viviparus]|uniref:Uncharacterized protein n=1 Tax=Dictyocaulus viviparus TaxID=29172 RepID=A0A0D8XRN9_DICVI|nr:hypothetical protein DICVIV_08901 [Dictyocaulus viviparus]